MSLSELAVQNMGVIDDMQLLFGPGMTALTGETGAGKTMIVTAIELLVGGRADSVLVRPGATEATVEGRFELDGDEVVLTRAVPADGRSRAYVNGRMATATVLAEWGARLVDLHGQHAHQSLLSAATQRETLDAFAGTDLGPLAAAQNARTALEAELATIGGDVGARAREMDLLRFQVDELRAAGLDHPDEDAQLGLEEDVLANAVAHHEAADLAHEALVGDGRGADQVALALVEISGRRPFAELEARLRGLAAELADVASEVRSAGERIVADPERLAAIRERRQLLHDLRRKYGTGSVAGGSHPDRSGTLADVIAYRDDAETRLDELDRHEERAAALEDALARADAEVAAAETVVGARRRGRAPKLAAAVEAELHALAMAKARVRIAVGADPGDDVEFVLSANPGTDPLPLAKVASGGELARAMLAIRLVLTAAPPTLVFDEVDAGIGGVAARAVGRALAKVATDHQVLVVTHLPHVAAFATQQVHVEKRQSGTSTSASARVLDRDGRVVELARMLSGGADSVPAQVHARELLGDANAELGSGRR